MSKFIAQVLVAAVCVAFGFALGRMYPADKGPSPRSSSGGPAVAGTSAGRPTPLPTPKGTSGGAPTAPPTTTVGPTAPSHEHERG